MIRRSLFALFLMCVVVVNAGAQSPIVIKFSHVVAQDTPKGKAAEYFKKLAETRTKGRVQVQVFPNSQLYKDKEELEALQLGAVQMLAPSLAKFGPLGAKEFEVFDLPYIFDSYDELHKVTQGPIGMQLLAKLDATLKTAAETFDFNTYDGKFRWYSFAIHGSNNDNRKSSSMRGQRGLPDFP